MAVDSKSPNATKFDYQKLFCAAAVWKLKRAWWWHRDMSDNTWIHPGQTAYIGKATMIVKTGKEGTILKTRKDDIVEVRWLTKARLIQMKLDNSW